ncbi:MAG TPA: DUF1579 family protein [Vicinamibacteria bacterium]|nr:DUF1579 family protein [Vicinamibacteria bacterium]
MTSLVCLLAASLAAQPRAQEGVSRASSPPSATRTAAARPSPDHDRLDVLAGTFRFERTTTLPGGTPQRSIGLSENRWILDNRYLECRAVETEDDGSVGDESLVTYGFDLRRRVFFAVLLGSRGSNYQTLEGFYDDPARSFVLIGKDAGDGRIPGPKLRQVVRIDGPDRYVVELFTVAVGRLPQKIVEITYSRQ